MGNGNGRNAKGQFVPGNTCAVGGRRELRRGPDLRAVKRAYIEAFDQIGGPEEFVKWAKQHKTRFYELLVKLFEKEVKIDAAVIANSVHTPAGMDFTAGLRERLGHDDLSSADVLEALQDDAFLTAGDSAETGVTDCDANSN